MRNELSGNKNHFAKFVKLKTENVSLASKLNHITKTIKSSEVAGIKTMGSKDKGNKFTLDFTGLPPPVTSTQDNNETGRNSINTNRTLNSTNANISDPPLTARSLVRHQIEQYKKQQIIEQEHKQLIQEYIRDSQPSPSMNLNDYDDMRLDVTPRRHEYEQMINEIVNNRLKGGDSPVELSIPGIINEQNEASTNYGNLGLARQLSSEILKSKENKDENNIYKYSVGKPRPPSANKKFDNQRVTTPTSSVLNGRVLV